MSEDDEHDDNKHEEDIEPPPDPSLPSTEPSTEVPKYSQSTSSILDMKKFEFKEFIANKARMLTVPIKNEPDPVLPIKQKKER